MNLSDYRLGKIPESEPIVGDLSRPCAIARSGVKRRLRHEVATKVITGGET